MSRFQRDIQTASFLNENDPIERVSGHIEFAIRRSQVQGSDKGCLLGNFALELSDIYPVIQALCVQKFETWAEMFKRDLYQAREKYGPSAPINTQSLADQFIVTLEGALILARAKQNSEVVRKSLEHFKNYIQTLFGIQR